MNLWNLKILPLPPVNTYRAVNSNIDLKNLHNICKKIKLFFENNEFMKAEYLVLSRIIYRMKQKFRSAKDFKALEKVHKALENYFNIQISKYVGIFMDMIPLGGKDIYLPTKNLLDYILVRFQGLVKLLERIVETSKIAGLLLNARTKVGHFWKVAFISFSLISRVYILAKHNANCICEFYASLYPFTSQLQNTKNDWLPKEYKLPIDLKEWMDVDWLDIDDDIQIIENSTETPDILHFFDLIKDEDDDVEFCDEYLMVDDDTDVEIVDYVKNLNKKKNCGSVSQRSFCNMVEDLGEVIDVDTISMHEKNKHFPDEAVKFNESIIEIEDTTKNKKNDGNKNTMKDKQINIKNILNYDADENSEVINISDNIDDKAEEDLGEVINIEDSISIIDNNDNCDDSESLSNGSVDILDSRFKKNVNKKSQKIGKNQSTRKTRGCNEEEFYVNNINNINEIEERFNENITGNMNGTVNKKLKKLDMSIQQFINDIGDKSDESVIEVVDITRKKRKNIKKKKLNIDGCIETKKLENCHTDNTNSIKKAKQKVEINAKNKRKRYFVSENVCSKKIKLVSDLSCNVKRLGHNQQGQHKKKNRKKKH